MGQLKRCSYSTTWARASSWRPAWTQRLSSLAVKPSTSKVEHQSAVQKTSSHLPLGDARYDVIARWHFDGAVPAPYSQARIATPCGMTTSCFSECLRTRWLLHDLPDRHCARLVSRRSLNGLSPEMATGTASWHFVQRRSAHPSLIVNIMEVKALHGH